MALKFFTYSCHCSVDSELIDRKDNAKNCVNCEFIAKHSSLLPFLSQAMSLNIDMNRILPVKVSGVCPKSLRRSLILSQSCNVVNPGKMFHSNSVGSPWIPS